MAWLARRAGIVLFVPACAAVPTPVSVTVTVAGPMAPPGAVEPVAVAAAPAADAFPSGWYDADDGSVVHLADPTDYALVWGRDVEPKSLVGAGFARDARTGAWRAHQIAPFVCEAPERAREIDQDVDLEPLDGGALRLETRLRAPLPECVAAMLAPPVIYTSRVLVPIRDAARARTLDALMADASSTRACVHLGRCCRSLRGRELRRTGGMCRQPTASSIECHDRRLEIATTLRLDAGPCVD